MTEQQPEALRLANELDGWVGGFSGKAADLLRNQHAEIERLRAELAALRGQEPALYVQCNHVSQSKYAPFHARICQQPIDGIATTPFYAAAGAQPALGWLRAVDEAMVCSHQGTAEARDDYATAKRKLNELICWNVAVEKELGAQPALSLCDRLCSEFQNAECPGDPGRPCCMEAQPAPSEWEVKIGEKLLPKAQPAQSVPAEYVTDATHEKVMDAIAAALGDAYDCLRVWGAWSYGTMSQDDFVQVVEQQDRLAEIADAAISAMLAAGAQSAPSVTESKCRNLLYGFMLDCNYVGIDQAAKNLHRALKEVAHGIKENSK